MLRGDTSLFSRDDASMRVEELFEKLRILIIDEFDIVMGEETLLFHKFND